MKYIELQSNFDQYRKEYDDDIRIKELNLRMVDNIKIIENQAE
jgi:hypothetical protein